MVIELTGATYNKKNLVVNPIRNPIVRYATMLIGYKIYFTNRDNSMSAITINVAYEIVEKRMDYDLCEFLRKQLMLQHVDIRCRLLEE